MKAFRPTKSKRGKTPRQSKELVESSRFNKDARPFRDGEKDYDDGSESKPKGRFNHGERYGGRATKET